MNRDILLLIILFKFLCKVAEVRHVSVIYKKNTSPCSEILLTYPNVLFLIPNVDLKSVATHTACLCYFIYIYFLFVFWLIAVEIRMPASKNHVSKLD